MCHFDRHSLQTNVICRVCPGNNSANCFCKPSTFSDMPQILSGTESLVLTWEVCFHKRSGKSRKSKCCTVVPFGFYLFWRRNWEKVKDGGESKGRKEGRGEEGWGPYKKMQPVSPWQPGKQHVAGLARLHPTDCCCCCCCCSPFILQYGVIFSSLIFQFSTNNIFVSGSFSFLRARKFQCRGAAPVFKNMLFLTQTLE